MLRRVARSLALTVPPIGRLYAENVALKQRLADELAGGRHFPKANGLRALLERLQVRGLRDGAAAVRNELGATGADGPGFDRGGALRDLLTFIAGNEWKDIPAYRVAAPLIESLAATGPVAPDVADALERLGEALLCLRGQAAAHYSLIFLRRNPLNGEPFDASLSPEGLFSHDERSVLAALAHEVAADGMKVAEIGCFSGRGSTRVLAAAVRPYGGSVVCIDTFPDIGGFANLRDLFEQSTAALGFRNLLQVIDGHSRNVAPRFADGYFDLIFIDGGHGYDDANADIRAWRSKVRPGGILCGHDCIRTADEFTAAQMRAMMEGDTATPRAVADPRDPSRNVWAHPGVIAAVAENFGTDVQVAGEPCGVWSHRVAGAARQE